MAEQTMEDAGNVQLDLQPCSICTRTFLPASLAKHTRVCERNATRKRKVFDSLKQRVEGTDLAPFHQKSFLKKNETTTPVQKIESKQSKWKEKHIELVNAIRAAKGTSNMPSTLAKRSSTTLGTPTHERCPSCDRQFGPKAFDRHVEWCKDKKTTIHKSPASVVLAKERLEARTKYKVPPLTKSKRAMTREKYSPQMNRTESVVSMKSVSACTFDRSPSIRKSKNLLHGKKSVDKMSESVGNQGDQVAEKIIKEKVEQSVGDVPVKVVQSEKNLTKEVKKCVEPIKSVNNKRLIPFSKINKISVNEDVQGLTVSHLSLNDSDSKKYVTWKDTVKCTKSEEVTASGKAKNSLETFHKQFSKEVGLEMFKKTADKDVHLETFSNIANQSKNSKLESCTIKVVVKDKKDLNVPKNVILPNNNANSNKSIKNLPKKSTRPSVVKPVLDTTTKIIPKIQLNEINEKSSEVIKEKQQSPRLDSRMNNVSGQAGVENIDKNLILDLLTKDVEPLPNKSKENEYTEINSSDSVVENSSLVYICEEQCDSDIDVCNTDYYKGELSSLADRLNSFESYQYNAWVENFEDESLNFTQGTDEIRKKVKPHSGSLKTTRQCSAKKKSSRNSSKSSKSSSPNRIEIKSSAVPKCHERIKSISRKESPSVSPKQSPQRLTTQNIKGSNDATYSSPKISPGRFQAQNLKDCDDATHASRMRSPQRLTKKNVKSSNDALNASPKQLPQSFKIQNFKSSSDATLTLRRLQKSKLALSKKTKIPRSSNVTPRIRLKRKQPSHLIIKIEHKSPPKCQSPRQPSPLRVIENKTSVKRETPRSKFTSPRTDEIKKYKSHTSSRNVSPRNSPLQQQSPRQLRNICHNTSERHDVNRDDNIITQYQKYKESCTDKKIEKVYCNDIGVSCLSRYRINNKILKCERFLERNKLIDMDLKSVSSSEDSVNVCSPNRLSRDQCCQTDQIEEEIKTPREETKQPKTKADHLENINEVDESPQAKEEKKLGGKNETYFDSLDESTDSINSDVFKDETIDSNIEKQHYIKSDKIRNDLKEKISRSNMLYLREQEGYFSEESVVDGYDNRHSHALSVARIEREYRRCSSDVCLHRSSETSFLSHTDIDLRKLSSYECAYLQDSPHCDVNITSDKILEIAGEQFLEELKNSSRIKTSTPIYHKSLRSPTLSECVPMKRRKLDQEEQEESKKIISLDDYKIQHNSFEIKKTEEEEIPVKDESENEKLESLIEEVPQKEKEEVPIDNLLQNGKTVVSIDEILENEKEETPVEKISRKKKMPVEEEEEARNNYNYETELKKNLQHIRDKKSQIQNFLESEHFKELVKNSSTYFLTCSEVQDNIVSQVEIEQNSNESVKMKRILSTIEEASSNASSGVVNKISNSFTKKDDVEVPNVDVNKNEEVVTNLIDIGNESSNVSNGYQYDQYDYEILEPCKIGNLSPTRATSAKKKTKHQSKYTLTDPHSKRRPDSAGFISTISPRFLHLIRTIVHPQDAYLSKDIYSDAEEELLKISRSHCRKLLQLDKKKLNDILDSEPLRLPKITTVSTIRGAPLSPKKLKLPSLVNNSRPPSTTPRKGKTLSHLIQDCSKSKIPIRDGKISDSLEPNILEPPSMIVGVQYKLAPRPSSNTGKDKKKTNLASLKRSISLLDPVQKPKPLKNREDVQNYFNEQELKSPVKQEKLFTKVETSPTKALPEENNRFAPKAEELFSVDDEMYEEYKKYEEMYLKEKEEKLKKEERRISDGQSGLLTASEDDDSQQQSVKLSGDSAYGRKTPKVRARCTKLTPLDSQHNLTAESPNSSSSESSPIIPLTPPVQKMSKFCHECGNRYPVCTAKFCVECGVRRLVL